MADSIVFTYDYRGFAQCTRLKIDDNTFEPGTLSLRYNHPTITDFTFSDYFREWSIVEGKLPPNEVFYPLLMAPGWLIAIASRLDQIEEAEAAFAIFVTQVGEEAAYVWRMTGIDPKIELSSAVETDLSPNGQDEPGEPVV